MSFHAETKRMRDVSLPIGVRYLAMLHALERGHRKFYEGLSLVESRFGVRRGEKVSSELLIEISVFLDSDRQTWSDQMAIQRQMNREKKRE
jgi:hypothetical protein